MKVLLWGEFSGVHSDLASALREMGHDVFFVSTGDVYKGFNSSLNLPIHQGRSVFARYIHWKELRYRLRPLGTDGDSFDVVQMINPLVNYWYFTWSTLRNIISRSSKRFLLACGSDPYINPLYEVNPRFKLWKSNQSSMNRLRNVVEKLYTDQILRYINGVIPCTNGLYRDAYSHSSLCLPTIPFPIDLTKLPPPKKHTNLAKLKIFLGYSSRPEKGSFLLREVLNEFVEHYKNDVELTVVESLPFNKYIEEMSDADIVVDQVGGDALGMNTLYAMGMGKVVLTSYSNDVVYDNCPAFPINDDPSVIFSSLENILSNRKNIPEISSKSIDYVREYHCSKKVANLYLSAWSGGKPQPKLVW